MRLFSKFTVILFATLAISGGLSASATADPILVTQGGYLSQNDSPFNSSNSGHSRYSGFTETGFTFTFDADQLPMLPSKAGVAWTDMGWHAPTPYGAVMVDVFGPSGTWLGTMNPYLLGDGTDTGQQGEDFGVINDGGISGIGIGTDHNDWEVDHGSASPAPVPEPSTLLLVGAGAAGLLRKRFAARATQKRSVSDDECCLIS
jgi:hypothetical protein